MYFILIVSVNVLCGHLTKSGGISPPPNLVEMLRLVTPHVHKREYEKFHHMTEVSAGRKPSRTLEQVRNDQREQGKHPGLGFYWC